MDNIRNFLESSTIHGLSYISTTRKYMRLFWILTVIGGFTGAGYMIYQSFDSWNESPVKTTIKTLPITEIKFPKVTVCSPRNTYTDLNYDLIMAENMTLDNDTRNALSNYATELLYDHLNDKITKYLSNLEDDDRYYNWYHGYTEIQIPFINNGKLKYSVEIYAPSGSISTQYFGEEFNAANVETRYQMYIISGSIPVTNNPQPPPTSPNPIGGFIATFLKPQTPVVDPSSLPKVTLHLQIECVPLEDLPSGKYDDLILTVEQGKHLKLMDSKNYTPPSNSFKISLHREGLSTNVVRKQKLTQMPGFRVTWHYSGIKAKPLAKYDNKDFVRNGSINNL